MYKGAIVIVLILASNIEALELPSEVDLRAAYCIPIAQHALNMFRSIYQNL